MNSISILSKNVKNAALFLIAHWIKHSSKERGGQALGSAETDDASAAS